MWVRPCCALASPAFGGCSSSRGLLRGPQQCRGTSARTASGSNYCQRCPCCQTSGSTWIDNNTFANDKVRRLPVDIGPNSGMLIKRVGDAGCFADDNSVLQQLFDPLIELFERFCAFDPLAIDEEGRRRIDLQHLVGELFIGR
jgi:hypothetical protein